VTTGHPIGHIIARAKWRPFGQDACNIASIAQDAVPSSGGGCYGMCYNRRLHKACTQGQRVALPKPRRTGVCAAFQMPSNCSVGGCLHSCRCFTSGGAVNSPSFAAFSSAFQGGGESRRFIVAPIAHRQHARLGALRGIQMAQTCCAIGRFSRRDLLITAKPVPSVVFAMAISKSSRICSISINRSPCNASPHCDAVELLTLASETGACIAFQILRSRSNRTKQCARRVQHIRRITVSSKKSCGA